LNKWIEPDGTVVLIKATRRQIINHCQLLSQLQVHTQKGFEFPALAWKKGRDFRELCERHRAITQRHEKLWNQHSVVCWLTSTVGLTTALFQ
jgi:hypothetical protein